MSVGDGVRFRSGGIFLAVAFVVIGALVGGLVHNPFDPQRYANGALGLLQGQNIYQLKGVVYPPLLYAFAAILLSVVSLVPGLGLSQYVLMAVFVAIGTATQALSYVLGGALVPDDASSKLALAVLLNPFVIYVVVLFGQMESFIVLGIFGVIYAERTGRWELGGALLAIAASVKLYPAILFLPFLWRNRSNASRIVRGAAPVVVITALLMVPFLPASSTIFISAFYGIRPINALYILSFGTIPSWLASLVFVLTFVLAGVIAAVARTDGHVNYLLPLVPIVLFYPDVIAYRWLPLAVSALLIGYLPSDSSSVVQDVCRRYGWLWIVLGTAAVLIGTILNWHTGDPWLVATTGTLPELDSLFGGWLLDSRSVFGGASLAELSRTIVAVVFIASVVNWSRVIFRRSRARVL